MSDAKALFVNDVVTAVTGALREIGGLATVERYDGLIERREGFQFLHGEREAVAQALIERQALQAAAAAATTQGLPVYETHSS